MRPEHRLDGRILYGGEGAGVDVALDGTERLDRIGVAGGERDTPAGHVVALGAAEQLDGHVLGTRSLKQTDGLVAVEADLGVGVVVDEEQVVLLGERDSLVEVLRRGRCRGGVVGVAQEHHLGLGEHICRNVVEVGQEVVLLVHRHEVALATGEDAAGLIDGIAAAGNERVVAGIDECEEDVRDALFGADEGDDLVVGVDIDIEAVLHPLGARLAIGLRAVVAGVSVVVRLARGIRHRVYDVVRGRHVGITDTERDDVDPLSLLRLLLAVDLGEQVRRQIGDTVCGPHGSTSPSSWCCAGRAEVIARRPSRALRTMVADLRSSERRGLLSR